MTTEATERAAPAAKPDVPDTLDAIDVSALKPASKKQFDEVRRKSQQRRFGQVRPPHPVRLRLREMKPGETLPIPCTRELGKKIQNSHVQAARRDLKLPAGAFSSSYDYETNRLYVHRWENPDANARKARN